MEPYTEDSFVQDSKNTIPHVHIHEEKFHFHSHSGSDEFARSVVNILARIMDAFFKERYGHRAVVLETIAAVPGMVGGMFQHLKALRHIRDDRGWIRALVDEAENERMHLMVYSKLAKPSGAERLGIVLVQFFFYHFYFLLYLISPRTAHRVVGYLEEQAIQSYEHFLKLVEDGFIENVEAPELAKSYWQLKSDARLTDVILATIKDEMIHRDVNHRFANDKEGTNLWK